MFATAFFLAALFLGWSLVRKLTLRLSWADAAAAAIVLGLLVASWVGLLASVVFGFAIGLPLAALVMFFVALALAAGKPTATFESKLPSRSALGTVLWAVYIIGWAFVLATFFQSHMLQAYAGGWYSAGGSWGDLGLHTALISHFAEQARPTFELPVYAGAKLTYPFLIDFFSAVLLRGGWTWQACLAVPGFLLAISMMQLLFAVAQRMFGRVRAGVIAGTLFLTGGSFAGFLYALDDWKKSGLKFGSFLAEMPFDYANLPLRGLNFTSPVTTLLLPQRGFLFGLPIFFLSLLLLKAGWDNEVTRRRSWLWAGALIGLLPFAHVHTFLVAGCCLAWLTAWGGKRRLDGVLAGALALAIATPQLAWQFAGTYHDGFGFFRTGWMTEPGGSVLRFLVTNWGLSLVALLAVPLWLARRKGFSFVVHVSLAMVLVGIAANVYIFQPNDYDNLKLLLYVYIMACLLGGEWLGTLFDRGPFAAVLAVLLIASWGATGSLAMIREAQQSFVFLSDDDVAFAGRFKEAVPPGSLILTGDRHNSPVTTLTGRPVLMGYRGWLWTYGIDYSTREADEKAMFSGGERAEELLRQYGIDYVAIGPSEVREWHADKAYFEQRYPVVLKHGQWEVFRVGSDR